MIHWWRTGGKKIGNQGFGPCGRAIWELSKIREGREWGQFGNATRPRMEAPAQKRDGLKIYWPRSARAHSGLESMPWGEERR